MTDTTDGTTELERLLARRRDELAEERPAGAEESTDEKLLTAALNEVFGARQEREHRARAARAAANSSREAALNRWALIIPIVVLIASASVATWGGTPVTKFQLLAAAAAVVGAIAAFVRLWAHDTSKALDGIGKALGLTSAIFAGTATIALIMLVK